MNELPDLYTSRWKNQELARLRCQPVSISRGDGRRPGFSYKKLWKLCPSRETFAITSPNAAAASYRAGLDELGVEYIEDRLRRLSRESGGLPLVLLCHEDVLGQDHCCHRRWLARWYEEQTGIEIPELEPGDLPEVSGVAQQRLF